MPTHVLCGQCKWMTSYTNICIWSYISTLLWKSKFHPIKKTNYHKLWLLKALCHAIRADCLLMNLHAANKNWAWRTANKFVSHIQVCLLRLCLQRVRHFKHRICSIALTYQYSYPLATHSWRSWASRLSHQQSLCAARIRPPHTPMHYTVILGVPILPAPTLIEFLN